MTVHEKPELIDTILEPGLADAQAGTLEIFEEMQGQLEKEMSRLSQLRKVREDDPGQRLAHQVLHSSFERAVDWRMLARNPAAARLDLPRMQRAPLVTWTPEQARAFVAATASDRLHPFWTLMLSSVDSMPESVNPRSGANLKP